MLIKSWTIRLKINIQIKIEYYRGNNNKNLVKLFIAN